MRIAEYIVGQERRLVNPPSQVVAGVRTVTTTMDGRDVLPRLSRPFAFSAPPADSNQPKPHNNTRQSRVLEGAVLNRRTFILTFAFA
jgi:hypothetical protein